MDGIVSNKESVLKAQEILKENGIESGETSAVL